MRVFTHTHTDKQTDTHTYRRYDDINIPSFQMGITMTIIVIVIGVTRALREFKYPFGPPNLSL